MVREEKQIKIDGHIYWSTATVDSILDYAEEIGVDLIVVGTKGRSGIKKLSLGSTASGIVIYSHCPVTIVK